MMEALLTQYASSSEEEEEVEEEEEERSKEKKSFQTKKVGKAVVVDPAPNVNVANLASGETTPPGWGGGGRGGGGGDDDDGRTRGGEGDALVVVPKSDVAVANGEAFFRTKRAGFDDERDVRTDERKSGRSRASGLEASRQKESEEPSHGFCADGERGFVRVPRRAV